jgi:hypothetical protein
MSTEDRNEVLAHLLELFFGDFFISAECFSDKFMLYFELVP